MDNSIWFLGTSHGAPSKTRFCSSTLYRFGRTSFLVDVGEPVSALLFRYGIKPGSIGAALVTHFHADHVSGIFQLLFVTPQPADGGERPLWLFPEANDIDAFRAFQKASHGSDPDSRVRLEVFPEDRAVYLGGNRQCAENEAEVKITAIPNRHLERDGCRSLSYLMESDGMRILHTGDLCEDLNDLAARPGDEPLDLCVCEATHWFWEKEKAVEALRKAPVRRFVFNHVGPYWTDGEEDKLWSVLDGLPCHVDIARDGQVYPIGGNCWLERRLDS